MKQAIANIFSDLDQFRKFCVRFGYRYNEADLYRHKSYAYSSYLRFKDGKKITNHWGKDARGGHRR